MRILFLDIDGVLHPATDDAPVELFCWFDHLFALLSAQPDVFIVVHSTWRYTHTPQEIGDLLGVLSKNFLGVVPRGQRHEAIQWWLSQNPSVQSYRILDDQPREFGAQPPPELVVCHPLTGVSAPEVLQQLRHWLATT